MTTDLNFDLEQLFEEIVEEGLTNGVMTEAAYHDLVEGAIEERRRHAEIDDDQNTEAYATVLKERWPEYQQRLGHL